MAPFSSRLSMAFCGSYFLFLVGNSMGVLVSGGDVIPTVTGRPNVCILMICTRLAGSANAGQNQLGETLPMLLHWREPLGVPAFFWEAPNFPRLVGSQLQVLPVVRVVSKKLLLDLFCYPVYKDCWLPSRPKRGPNLWCTYVLVCVTTLGTDFFWI